MFLLVVPLLRGLNRAIIGQILKLLEVSMGIPGFTEIKIKESHSTYKFWELLIVCRLLGLYVTYNYFSNRLGNSLKS